METNILAKQILEDLRKIEDIKVKSFCLFSQQQNNIIIEVKGENKKKWDYFAYKLRDEYQDIKIHCNEKQYSFIFSNDDQKLYLQLDSFKRCLYCKYYLIEKPKKRNLVLILKSTSRCNLNCKYCYDEPVRKKTKHIHHISDDKLIHLFSLLRDYTEKVELIWHGGEPLVSGIKFYENFYDNILPKFPQLGVQSCMQSNGTLLTKEWIDLFKKYDIHCGFSYQALSWGTRGESWDGKKPKGVDENTVPKAMELYSKEIEPAGVLDVVTKDDIDILIDKYEFYKKHKWEGCFNEVFAAGADETGKLSCTDENTKKYIEGLKKYVRYWLFDTEGYGDRFAEEMFSLILGCGGNLCHFSDCFTNYCSINANGDMYHCDRPVWDKYRAGNVMDFTSFDDFFRSIGVCRLENENRERLKKCYKCSIFSYCRGHCPLMNIDTYGDATKSNPSRCYIRKEMLQFTFDLLWEIEDINSTNPAFRDLVRKYNRYLPYEILEIGLELKIKSINELFVDVEHSMDFKKSPSMQIFRALNPFIRSEHSYLGVPLPKNINCVEPLSDKERLAALPTYLKKLKNRIEEEYLGGFGNEK